MKALSLLVVALVGFIGTANAQFDPSDNDVIKGPKEQHKVELVKLTQLKMAHFDPSDHDGIKRPKEANHA